MKGIGKVFEKLWSRHDRRGEGFLAGYVVVLCLGTCMSAAGHMGGFGYQHAHPPAAPWGGHVAQPLFTYHQPAYGAYGYGGGYGAAHQRFPQPIADDPWGGSVSEGHTTGRHTKQPPVCRIKNCSTLGGFKQCLATKGSPYASYVHQPVKAETQSANDAFQEFVHRRPKCYRAFCLGTCTEVSPRIQNAPPPRVRPETATTFRESQKAAALLTAYHRRKRWAYAHRVCQQDSLAAQQLRMLCSACDEVLEGTHPIVAPCQIQILGVDDDGKLEIEQNNPRKSEITEERIQDKISGQKAKAPVLLEEDDD